VRQIGHALNLLSLAPLRLRTQGGDIKRGAAYAYNINELRDRDVATSIIEFWRRWHITLSRFLRQYLYIPLGGNRGGRLPRYRNLMITMLLGGFWHGAGWNFLLWGGLHGAMLIVNHQWREATAQWLTLRRNTLR